MGYHDAFNTALDTSRNFYSTATGKIITFSDWANEEPSNLGRREHCAFIWDYFDYHWNDFDCESKTGYICEEHSYTTKYRRDLEAKQLAVFQTNTKLFSEITSSQSELNEEIESVYIDVDNLLLDYRKSTTQMINAWRKSIDNIIEKYPYMISLLNNFDPLFTEIGLENEKTLEKLTNKVRENNEKIYARLKEETNVIMSEISSNVTENRNDVNKLLVFGS